MGCKLARAEEGPGCDEAAAAAAGTWGDCGGGAPRRSASPTPSTSSTSPPQSPTPTPSSTSSADERLQEYLWGEEQEFDRLQVSMNITDSQEDEREEEEEVDRLQESLGTTYLNSTNSEIQDIENNDTGGVSNSRSKLGHKEPVLTLDNFDNEVITGKIMLLSKKYGFFRRIPGDGSCFYRAFIFNYLEKVVEIRDENKRKTEAARLRQRVEKHMLACLDEDLLPAFYGFESVVNLIEQGLPAGELYRMEINEHVTSRMRPGNGEANDMQVVALVNALGIPVIVENLDRSSPVRLKPRHVYPSQESEAEALELEQSIDSDDSTTPMAQVEHDGLRNLSLAERRRLVTLLYRPGHYDILYPK